MRHLRRDPRRLALRGATLIELAVSSVVLSILVLAVGLAMLRTDGAFRQGVATSSCEADVRRILDRAVAELRDADRSSLALTPAPPLPSSSVDYARVTGIVAGVATLGPTRRLRWQIAAGELDNGLDDDGDGLVDEGQVELLPDVAGAPGTAIGIGSPVRELLEGEVQNGLDDNGNGLVDEPGLCITQDATTGTVTLRLTIEEMGPGRRLVTRTVETAVRARNE
jgi:hypothetical protein